LAEELEKLRWEAKTGRADNIEGLDKETTTFYAHIADLAFGEAGYRRSMPADEVADAGHRGTAPGGHRIIDFWTNSAEQKHLRGELNKALLMADIPEVTANYERLAVEVMKLAKNRHDELLRH